MNTTIITTEEKSFIESLKQIVRAARRMAYTAIDYAQIQSNWLIGQRVVEQMQKGAERAEYGAHVIKIASDALTEEFGSGYSETNIRNFRTFYLTFNDLQIQQTLSDELEPTCKPIGVIIEHVIKAHRCDTDKLLMSYRCLPFILSLRLFLRVGTLRALRSECVPSHSFRSRNL